MNPRELRYSVIIPAYNSARWIGATLESWVAQTDTRFEVIVVDDGSTDETVAIAESFASRLRLRVISGRSSGGPAKPRNTGIAAAQADLIVMCDADDLAHPLRLQKTGEAWDLVDRRACVLLADFDEIDADGRVLATHGMTRFTILAQLRYRELSPTVRLLEGRNAFEALLHGDFHRTCSLAFAREVLCGVLSYDESLKNGQDYDLILRVTAAGVPLLRIYDSLGLYRVASGNISSRPLSERAPSRIAVLRKTMLLAETHRQRALIRNWLAVNYDEIGYDRATSGALRESLAAYWCAATHNPSFSVLKGVVRALYRAIVFR